jgi:hypothetical protein
VLSGVVEVPDESTSANTNLAKTFEQLDISNELVDLPSDSDESTTTTVDDTEDEDMDENDAISLIELLNEMSRDEVDGSWNIVESKKRHNKLCSNGFLYLIDKERTLKRMMTSDGRPIQRQYWKCEIPSCTGRGTSDFYTPPFTLSSAHNEKCVANKAQGEVYIKINKLKHLAATSTCNPRTIIKETLSGMTEEARALVSSTESLRGIINRVRKQVAGFGADAMTLADIEIPETLHKTLDGKELFYFHDTGTEDPQRIIIFTTKENLKWLGKLRDWLGDGTFDIAPKTFRQLYTIHGLKNHKTLPLVYALLPDKKKETYIRFFTIVIENVKHKPKSFNTDFEQAVFGAIKEVFKDCEIYGCFFHLSQNLFKRVKSMKLTHEYVFGEDFRRHFKMIQGLAFLPPEDVVTGLDELRKLCAPKLKPLLDYFEKNYVGNLKRASKRNPIPNERKTPPFKIEIWNVRDRTLANLPRTNNNLESWHNAIQSETKKHSAILRVIQYLRTEQDFTSHKQVRISIGDFNDKANANEQLINVIKDYDKEHLVDFLESIALTLTSMKHGVFNSHSKEKQAFNKEKYGEKNAAIASEAEDDKEDDNQ